MSYKIVWTKRAIENLQSIYDYISEDSQFQAQKAIKEVIECVEVLESFPNMGVVVKEFPQYGLRELLKYSYRIIYKVKDSNLQIITFVHSKQNFKTAYYKH